MILPSYPHFEAFGGRKPSCPHITLRGRPSNPVIILISACQWQPSAGHPNVPEMPSTVRQPKRRHGKVDRRRSQIAFFGSCSTRCAPYSINRIIRTLIPIPVALESDSRRQHIRRTGAARTSIREALVVQRVTGTFGIWDMYADELLLKARRCRC